MPKTEKIATPETGTFEIIYTCVLLNDLKAGDRRGTELFGDVARLSSGRVVCRVAERDSDNETVHGFDDFSLDPIARRPVSPTPTYPAKTFDTDVQRIDVAGGLERYTPRDYRKIAAEFQTVWQELYPDFSILDDHFPAPLFNPGTVVHFCRVRATNEFDKATLPRYVQRHMTAQDFGTVGKFDPTPPSVEELWTRGLLTEARENSIAILTGNGQVVSRYLLPEQVQEKWRQAQGFANGSKSAALELRTLLRRNGNRSLARVVAV